MILNLCMYILFIYILSKNKLLNQWILSSQSYTHTVNLKRINKTFIQLNDSVGMSRFTTIQKSFQVILSKFMVRSFKFSKQFSIISSKIKKYYEYSADPNIFKEIVLDS